VPVGTYALTRLAKKLADVRGEGAYVAAPPSLHPDTKQPYETLYGGPHQILLVEDADRLVNVIANLYAGERKIDERVPQTIFPPSPRPPRST
jgi:hypothetical protein